MNDNTTQDAQEKISGILHVFFVQMYAAKQSLTDNDYSLARDAAYETARSSLNKLYDDCLGVSASVVSKLHQCGLQAESGKTRCCYCVPHEGCEMHESKQEPRV